MGVETLSGTREPQSMIFISCIAPTLKKFRIDFLDISSGFKSTKAHKMT